MSESTAPIHPVFEKCYCTWPEGKGDDCMYCLKCNECCEPCCGQPCNGKDGVYCAVSWIIFCLAGPKFLAASQQQECHFVNHGVPYLLLLLALVPCIGGILAGIVGFWIATSIRANLRKVHGIGIQQWDICDCCATLLPCMYCQELRSMPKESWDWIAAIQENKYPVGGSIEPCYKGCIEFE